MKKRIFIAINLPDRLKDIIQEKVLSKCIYSFSGCRAIIWEAPEKLHITLKFLGWVDEEKIAEISKALRQIIPQSAFKLTVGGMGVFPNLKNPRVIWLGVEKNEILEILADNIREALEKIGFLEDDYEFSAHITLARIKESLNDIDRKKLENLVSQMQDKTFGHFKVLSVDIMESKMLSTGSEYRIVETIDLK